jgi:excisionase family DNA binding protein
LEKPFYPHRKVRDYWVHGAYPQASDVTRGSIDGERINTLDSANPEERLLSVKDVAFILNCGLTKAWAIVNTREIQTIRIGRLVRISPEDLAEFMHEHRS